MTIRSTDAFTVVLTEINPVRTEARVNDRLVGAFRIITRIVPCRRFDYADAGATEQTAVHYNREVTKLVFRCSRDGFSRGAREIAPGSTMTDVADRISRMLDLPIHAYLNFYRDEADARMTGAPADLYRD